MTSIPLLLIPRNQAEARLKNQIQRGKAVESSDLSLEGQIAAEKIFCQMLGMEDFRRRPCEPPLVVRL